METIELFRSKIGNSCNFFALNVCWFANIKNFQHCELKKLLFEKMTTLTFFYHSSKHKTCCEKILRLQHSLKFVGIQLEFSSIIDFDTCKVITVRISSCQAIFCNQKINGPKFVLLLLNARGKVFSRSFVSITSKGKTPS